MISNKSSQPKYPNVLFIRALYHYADNGEEVILLIVIVISTGFRGPAASSISDTLHLVSMLAARSYVVTCLVELVERIRVIQPTVIL